MTTGGLGSLAALGITAGGLYAIQKARKAKKHV